VSQPVLLKVDEVKRRLTANNHSATHLLHAALRKVLGTHIEQKGSLVDENRLRFDFSHFTRLTSDEILKIEAMANGKIWENLPLKEWRNLPMEEAQKMGAMALFGERYGEMVRVVAFDPEYSVELCGGTHVKATGQIGLIKIISETGIAAGIRRIEAVTGTVAVAFYNQQLQILEEIKTLVKNPVDALKGVKNLLEEKQKLTLEVENLRLYKINSLLQILSENIKKANGINFLSIELDVDVQMAKDLLFDLKRRFSPFVGLIAYINQNKPGFSLIVSDELIETGKVDARELVKVLSPCIKGSGGGQAGFVTAGGSFTKGVSELLDKAKQLFAQIDS